MRKRGNTSRGALFPPLFPLSRRPIASEGLLRSAIVPVITNVLDGAVNQASAAPNLACLLEAYGQDRPAGRRSRTIQV
jgi:hypothetical protein